MYKVWDVDSPVFKKELGVFQGVFHESGIYDSSPFRETLTRYIDEAKLNSSDRILLTGATNLDTGDFVHINKTSEYYCVLFGIYSYLMDAGCNALLRIDSTI